jgi:hypothetical protein
VGRKGVSKRKPKQAKSRNPAGESRSSELPIVEKQSAKSSESKSPMDWKNNSKKE